MIGSLRGVVLERGGEAEILLEVAGVGYRVLVAPRALAGFTPGASVFVHIHHHQREDAQILYGFASREERVTFELLLKANGVGPALAMAILATHTPAALREIVATADLGALCLVPGVGKKTAERLLIELKNRLDLPDAVTAAVVGAEASAPSVLSDVREALAQLGYSTEEIREALRDAPVGIDAAALLRASLKALGARRA